MMNKHIVQSIILLCASLCSACSYGSRQNFEKIPDTSFFPHPLQYLGEPFDGEWRAPEHKAIQGDLYIRIAPVTVEDPLTNADPKLVNAARHLAKRFEVKLKEEFAKLGSYNIFLVEEAPKGKTLLTIQSALIDLNVTNVTANLAGQAAGIYIPGAAFIASFFDDGHITCAIKVFAGDKLVAEFAELDTTPISLIGSLDDYSAYGHQRDTIDQWAHSIAEDVKNFAAGRRVHGATRIQLISGYTSEIAEEKD